MTDKVSMIAGVFFGLLVDKTSVQFIFQISTLLPLLGVVTGFLPNIEPKEIKK